MSDVVTDDQTSAPRDDREVASPLGWALAGMSAGAGAIHFAMTPVHAGIWQDRYGFAAAAAFQLGLAGVILVAGARKRVVQVAVIGNLFLTGMWLWSRTLGLPFGETPNVAEDVGAIDLACVALQVGVVLLGLRILLAPEKRSLGRVGPAMAAVGAIAIATVVIASPDAANHNHGTQLTGLDAEAAKVDETRCDTEFNPPSYWAEAAAVGVDTRWAGSPPGVAAATSPDGHNHGGTASTGSGSLTSTTLLPDPYDGRGSPGLDTLISSTDAAAQSELDAAGLITDLSHASEEDYQAWLWWLQSSGSLAHTHSATSSAEDGSGHGGHVGPQPWKAMTNQKDCDRLSDELDLARETALSYPTAQDAMDAGYKLVAPYLPGIAAHFIKYDLVDGEFEIDKPEMILYDGNGPDAKIVGLSYYLFHPGNTKPTQGFTGDNDSGHRHLGLCSAPTGGIIGDSKTTDAECKARGGSKSDGSSGWMSHAWVVPGCESPWGVFSAASPVLDDSLSAASGEGGAGCASSGVRDRYDMGDAPADDGETAAPAGASAGD